MDIESQNNLAWIIKYRPKTLKDVVGQEAKQIQKILEKNDLRHLFFYSRTPGTGKTTIAKALINDLDADYLEINSSDDRGIETIREKIKHFVNTMSSKPGVKKIVFLDEMDSMTKVAQEALRNMIEKFTHNAIFILTCNYMEKVLEPLRNRCEQFHFTNPDKLEIKEYLLKIITKEGLKYTDKGLEKLIDINYPSIRGMVGQLQKFHTLEMEINEQFVKKQNEVFEEYWTMIKKGEVLAVRKELLENGVEADTFIKFLFEKTYTDESLQPAQQVKSTIAIADVEYRMSVGADRTIQLICGLFQIYRGLVSK